MSLDRPDMPFRPQSWYRKCSTRSTVQPFCCCSHRITPESSEPDRVPIGNPSSAVNPIDESTLRPFTSPHIDAPDPRCATTTRAAAISGACCLHRPGDVLIGQPVKPVAPHALLDTAHRGWRTGPPPPDGRDGTRYRSRPPAARRETARRSPFSTSSAGGLCSGASGDTASILASVASSTSTEWSRSARHARCGARTPRSRPSAARPAGPPTPPSPHAGRRPSPVG